VSFFYPARSEIGAELASGRGWDRMLRPILAEHVGDENDLVVDVGANLGGSLVEMRLGAPAARFVCLEPSRRFASALRRTVRANGWRNVRVLRVAAGAANERRTLYVNPTTASVVAAGYGERTPIGAERVDVRKLDDLLGDDGPVAFLKSDTDGFDLDVLLGAKQTIARDRPALFFELDPGLLAWGGQEAEKLATFLEDFGYGELRAFAPGGVDLGPVARADELPALAVKHGHLNVLAVAGRATVAVP